MQVLSARGFGERAGEVSSGEGSNSAFSEQVRRLLVQRERLMGEIWSEERQEAAELARAKTRIAAAEAAEKEHREAALEENSRCKLAEEKISTAEMAGYSSSWTEGDRAGFGMSRAVLLDEINMYREQLASARSTRATKAASERQRLDECINAIRTQSQENQALEANQQMAQAHLKALEAMASSSASQVHVRESALQNILRQLEEQESTSADIHVRQEVVEAQLEAALDEIQLHEAISAPSSWATRQLREYEEISQDCGLLKDEVERLKQDSAAAQEKIDRGLRPDSGYDDGLRESVEELRRACEAAASASYEVTLKKPLLESEVARLTTELMSEQRVVADLEALRDSICADSHTFRTGVDMRVAALNTQLHTEKTDAAAVMEFENMEQALRSELVEREADCQRLHLEAVERDQQLAMIMQSLQEQITALRTEEMEEEEAARRMSKASYHRSTGIHKLPSPRLSGLPAAARLADSRGSNLRPLGCNMNVHAIGVSAPPNRLQDPACPEPPPRRSLRRELSADSNRHSEEPTGGLASQRSSLANSRSQPLLPSSHHHRPPSPFEPRGEAYTRITSAHRPYWQELERGWHPSASTLHRSPNMLPREGLEATAFGSANLAGASWNTGSSDSSRLFHTHNASASFESNLFNTPPIPQAQRASPTATTLRRSSSTRAHIFADGFANQAIPRMEADMWTRGDTPVQRARTPPPRPPSAAPFATFGNPGTYASGDSLLGGRSASLTQQEPPLVVDDRRTAFQARLAELRGVIGASLQSLDEEEAADDASPWGGASISAREGMLWGRAQ